MKKTLLTIAIAITVQFSYAQFNTSNPTTTMDNVGIGTASPVGKLEIKGTNAGSYFDSSYANTLNGESGTNTDIGLLGLNFVGYNGGATRFRDLYIYNGKQVAITMFQGSTGNVGIGTTNPNTKLQIQSDANTSGAPDNAQLFITGNTSPGKRLSLAYNTSSNYSEIQSQAYTGSYTALNFNPNGGNVGIGTATPTASLQVDDASTDDNNIIVSNQKNGYASGAKNMLAFTQGTSASTLNGRIGFDYNSTTMQIINGTSIGLTVDPTGYVGIGTTTPHEALSVNGTIRSKEIKVEITNWPDYVFKKDYDLLSLSAVKSYIDKNQHLPDMPSEAEMAKDGLNLGEIMKLQTKKIEELTLYLIQEHKRLEDQQNINKSLQEQINQLARKMNN